MNEPVAWMVERTPETKGYGDTPYVTLLDATKSVYWIENKIPEGYTVIPLYTHPVKELHLSLQKSKETGELLAVTYTDDEHRIVEVLWQKPPVKEQDESFDRTASHMAGEYVAYKAELTDEEIRHIQAQCHLKDVGYDGFIMRFARAILRKAQEK